MFLSFKQPFIMEILWSDAVRRHVQIIINVIDDACTHREHVLTSWISLVIFLALLVKLFYVVYMPKPLMDGWLIYIYIMAGCVFVVPKEVFHHRNGNILTLCEWLNDENQSFLFKFNYIINKHFHLAKNFNHLKLRFWSVQFSHQACIGEPTKHACGC